jgi:chloramphenicol 3-O-phosphotransferase
MMMDARRIGIVGPCSSGKSTLARALRVLGYHVKEIMQEHCAAPAMWRRITNPDVLIYLDVSMDVAAQREKLTQPSSWWIEEREVRLAHARANCDFYVDTTILTPEEVLAQVVIYLQDSAGDSESIGVR